MRTTLNLDDSLVAEALKATRSKSKTEVVTLGLKALVERAARHRLIALAGKLPRAAAPERHRSTKRPGRSIGTTR